MWPLSLTQSCNVARWLGTEMTRTAGTQHGGDCPVPGIILWCGSEGKLGNGFRGWICTESLAVNNAYLAVAKMCSYLGDHCTDRTSALWPGWRNKLFFITRQCVGATIHTYMCMWQNWEDNYLCSQPLTLKNMNPWTRLQVTQLDFRVFCANWKHRDKVPNHYFFF